MATGKTKAPVMRRSSGVLAAILPDLKSATPTLSAAPSGAAAVAPATATPHKVGFAAAADALAAQEFIVGQVYKVPLFKLQKSENNARVYYSAEELDEMSASLAKGQDVPALGYVRDGRIVITDGEKRFRATANAGLAHLDVKIIATPQSGADEYELSRRINLERSTQTAIDDAVRWKEMIDKGEYNSQDHLAERLGLEKSAVSKVMGINRIPERLRRMMSDHKQTRATTIAYAISTIFDEKRELGAGKAEEIAQDVIEETAKNELGRNQVESLIAKKLSGPKSRAHAESSTVKYGESKGTLKVFPSRGQLDLSFKNLAPEKVDQLKTQIEKMLENQLAF